MSNAPIDETQYHKLKARAELLLLEQTGRRRTVAGRQNNNWVFMTCDGPPKYLVKFVPLAESERLEVEAGIHRLLANKASVPVPSLVAHRVSSREAYLVREVVEGQTLAETLQQTTSRAEIATSQQLVAEAGRYLAEFHAVRFDNKGLLRADGTVKPHDLFSDREYKHILARLAKHHALPPGQLDRLRALSADDYFNDRPNVLCHCDYTPNNILVDSEHVVAIIDFEWASACPPMDDLATFDVFADLGGFEELKRYFYMGYLKHRDLPRGYVDNLAFYRFYRLATMVAYQLGAPDERFDGELQLSMLELLRQAAALLLQTNDGGETA